MPPTPIGTVARPVVPVIIRRWSVIDRRAFDDLFFGHIARRGASVTLRRGGAARNTPAQVERGLDGKAALALPGDLTPACGAFAGFDQAATRNLTDDFAGGAGRGAQVYGRSDISRLGKCRRGGERQRDGT